MARVKKPCPNCEQLKLRVEKLLLQNANLLATIEDLEDRGDLVYLFEQDAIVDELARHIWPADESEDP